MPKKEPTKQQKAIINAISTNVAVSAGAGSGKTQVLIGRFIHILENCFLKGMDTNGKYSISVDQLVAITFTKKAAAEMRSRLRHALNDKIQSIEQAIAEQKADQLAGRLAIDFWKLQLERLPRTHISTIHSLCSYILRENPLEANLDPQFKVAEEYEGAEFVQGCLEQYVRNALKNKNEHVSELVEGYGLQSFFNQINKLLPNLKEIKAAGDLLQPYKDNLDSIILEKEEICDCLRELVEHSELYQKPATRAYKEALINVQENYVHITESIRQNPPDFAPMKNAFGAIKAMGDFKEIYNKIKELMGSIAAKEVDAYAVPIVEHWQAILEELYAEVQKEKLSADLLTFDDLETCCISLLKEYPEVRNKYHQHFAHIMVDEFQDTNDKQRELIYLLCGNSTESLQGNKLFVVGDPKQSIYRFRGADVSVFKRVQEEIANNGGTCLSMDINFRSRETVLAAVNDIFAPLLGDDATQDVFFSPLEPNIPYMEGGEPVEFYTALYDKGNKELKNELEANLVVAKILQLKKQGRALKDITILMRSITRLDVLLPALQRYNIPFVLHSGKGFFEEQEILDALNLLTALHNKYRNVELAGVLRSPYFGLDDETITKLFVEVKAGCLWDALLTTDLILFKESQRPLIERSRKILLELRQSVGACGLIELWQMLEQKLNLNAILSQQTMGAAKLANIKKLGNMIFTFVQEQQGTLDSWLEHVLKLRSYDNKEGIAALEAKDAIQIMTFHSSKGLEFPIVLLPFLEGEEPNDTDSVVFLAPNKLHPENPWGLGVKVLQNYDLSDTYLIKQLRAENRRLDFEERKRLLYVATTRAEQKLVLFASADKDKDYLTEDWQQKNWYIQLVNILPNSSAIARGDTEALVEFLVPLDKEQQEPLDTDSSLLRPLANYGELGNNYFSPSALQSYAHCPRYYFYHYGCHLPGYMVEPECSLPRGEQLDAATLGLLVHSTLEYYSKDRYDREELIHCFELAKAEHLKGRKADTKPAFEMLKRYLNSCLVPRLSKAEKELEFTLYTEGLEITGFIDCMYENEDGTWTIVDYKTGKVPVEEQGKNKGYMHQLALYRLAVQKLFGRSIKKCELHYLQELVVVGLDNDTEYEQYLAEALACCHAIGCLPNKEKAFQRSCGHQCDYCEYAYMCK